MASNSDIDVIDPELEKFILSSGTVALVQPLKARQFFRLMRIVTHGAGAVWDRVDLSFDGENSQAFVTKILALVVMALPDAEDEAIQFVQSMVKPEGLVENPGKDKAAALRNQSLWEKLVVDLENPELEDLFGIIELVVKREGKDLQALGKRLGALLQTATKTGQTTPEKKPSEKPSEVHHVEAGETVQPVEDVPLPMNSDLLVGSVAPST